MKCELDETKNSINNNDTKGVATLPAGFTRAVARLTKGGLGSTPAAGQAGSPTASSGTCPPAPSRKLGLESWEPAGMESWGPHWVGEGTLGSWHRPLAGELGRGPAFGGCSTSRRPPLELGRLQKQGHVGMGGRRSALRGVAPGTPQPIPAHGSG